jgi:bifunctional non-homologous end joining protein LigD
LRSRPLAERKATLEQLPRRVSAGIAYSDHPDAPGADVIRQACRMGLEGIISKRADQPLESVDQGAESERARGHAH